MGLTGHPLFRASIGIGKDRDGISKSLLSKIKKPQSQIDFEPNLVIRKFSNTFFQNLLRLFNLPQIPIRRLHPQITLLRLLMLGMILNHPFVSFQGFGVCLDKKIKLSHFHIGFDRKMTLRMMSDEPLHLLYRFGPFPLPFEEKGSPEPGLFSPLTIWIEPEELLI